jgi:hypothetical protein
MAILDVEVRRGRADATNDSAFIALVEEVEIATAYVCPACGGVGAGIRQAADLF